MNKITLLISVIILWSCQKPMVSQNLESQIPDEQQGQNTDGVDSPGGVDEPSPEPVNAGDQADDALGDNPNLPIGLQYSKPAQCTKIDFNNLRWPEQLSQKQLDLFATALNISGSFEGNKSWSNLTNNFDGMGLSMGLLNQTLGTGSLQPLLIEMRNKHYDEMKSYFGSTRFTSLTSMLRSWEGSSSLKMFASEALDDKLTEQDFSSIYDFEIFAEEGVRLSDLDMSLDEEQQMGVEGLQQKQFISQASKESNSVTWAVQNLYNGSSFKTEWKTELTRLCDSKNYRSIQLAAAQKLHSRALFFFNRFKLTEVRAYLLMYDFIVQNGGFYQANIDAYDSYLKSNPRASESQKLSKILELRLVQVRDKYREDVRARKSSIINGTGLVHGSNRSLAKEFCYSSNELY